MFLKSLTRFSVQTLEGKSFFCNRMVWLTSDNLELIAFSLHRNAWLSASGHPSKSPICLGNYLCLSVVQTVQLFFVVAPPSKLTHLSHLDHANFVKLASGLQPRSINSFASSLRSALLCRMQLCSPARGDNFGGVELNMGYLEVSALLLLPR